MRLKVLIWLLLFIGIKAIAQAPNITYVTPQNYPVGTAITPLAPTNTGGAVPATTYGQVITFAGSGATSFNNGTGTSATFNHPYNSTFDVAGNLYVADCFNHAIRKITPSAVVTTIAGSGFPGTANATGAAAEFNYPGGVVADAAGNIYVGDQTNNFIRKITPGGVVTTFAGNGLQGSVNGPAVIASFNSPAGLVFDASGNLYVADRLNNMIRRITPGGIVSTFAGSGVTGAANGTGIAASFYGCSGIAIDASGNFYVADQDNNMVRKITPAGVVSTLAGNVGYGSANGTGSTASFNQLFGLSVDPLGNVYVADEFNNLIRKITPAGVVTTLAGSGSAASVDGIGTSASFNYPSGTVYDGSGNLYITETVGNLIRKIALTGYTIDKTLPAGLTFSPTTGIITGTPTVVTPATVYTITAYNASGSSATTVTIATTVIPRTLTFGPIPPKIYTDPDFDPGATVDSGDPIIYTSSNSAIATIVNGKIHIVHTGTVNITASVASKAGYANVTPITQPLTINKAPQVITFAAIPIQRIGNPDITLTCTSNSGLVITITPGNTTVATTGASNGYLVKLLAVGTDTLTATQPGDANWLPATAIQVLTILSKTGSPFPNAFSPNGDGVNDTWDLLFLKDFPNCTVKIFNRSGQEVFTSIGYTVAWDGTYNNTILPTGPYYYIIDLKNGDGPISGTVNLVK